MSPKPFKLGDHCRAGHLLTEENTYTEGSRLRCLECLRIRKPLKEKEEILSCPQGHPYDRENTYIDKNGYKHCRTCQRETMAARREQGLDPNYSGKGQGWNNAEKTHCPQGHEYTEENTYWTTKGSRACRTCANAKSRRINTTSHGISVEHKEKLLLEQANKCKICKENFTIFNIPCIDHDHSCCPGLYSCGNCIRGILCQGCNRGLGDFKDNIDYLQSAIDYLDNHQPPNPDQLTLF